MSVTIIDYNQPEWLAEFNRRGKRIAELEHWGENKGEKEQQCLVGIITRSN